MGRLRGWRGQRRRSRPRRKATGRRESPGGAVHGSHLGEGFLPIARRGSYGTASRAQLEAFDTPAGLVPHTPRGPVHPPQNAPHAHRSSRDPASPPHLKPHQVRRSIAWGPPTSCSGLPGRLPRGEGLVGQEGGWCCRRLGSSGSGEGLGTRGGRRPRQMKPGKQWGGGGAPGTAQGASATQQGGPHTALRKDLTAASRHVPAPTRGDEGQEHQEGPRGGPQPAEQRPGKHRGPDATYSHPGCSSTAGPKPSGPTRSPPCARPHR